MKRHSWRFFLVGAGVAFALGCGGGGAIADLDAGTDADVGADFGSTDPGGDSSGDPGGRDSWPGDVPAVDPGGVDAPGADVAGEDVHAGDAALDIFDGGLTDAVTDAADWGTDSGADVPGPGAFGRPCEDGDDCDDGFCVQTEDGQVCSRDCRNDCPPGWTCRTVQAKDGTPVFRCVPATLNYCRPCGIEADCKVGGFPMAGLTCVPFGNTIGAFCLPVCARNEDCPQDTRCVPPPIDIGGGRLVCMPAQGTCDCSRFAIDSGAATPCTVFAGGLPWGCEGVRACGDQGLGDCDARVPAIESCNGIDDDCNGLTDEENSAGCTVYFLDMDLDGVGLEGQSRCMCGPSGRFTALAGGDCDDRNPLVSPRAGESCNLQDDNCDGHIDEEGAAGCQTYYRNADGDGFGADAGARCLCRSAGEFTATKGGDCDDEDPFAFPGALERCNGKDDNCDGRIDEDGAVACQTYYLDVDGDGYGVGTAFQCKCAAGPTYRATKVGDCNDGDPDVHPGAVEICNGMDDNCDGAADPMSALGCVQYLRDADGDGFGVTGDGQCLCLPGAVYRASAGGDCNDSDGAIHPATAEACNGIDDNCDGATDEPGALGCAWWFVDADGDGYGADGSGACQCGPSPTHRVQTPGDCDDTDPSVGPAAAEVCGNQKDDNCNGAIDEPGCEGCSNYYLDLDRDGWGVPGDFVCIEAPDPVLGFTALRPGDCDDDDPDVNPARAEVCNGIDDDCDGIKDGDGAVGCMPYFFDFDNDGFGLTPDVRCLCAPSGRYRAPAGGDCNDQDRLINPGATEACNGKDDDCDGVIDGAGSVGCGVYLRDEDGDGFGVDADGQCLCAATGLYRATIGGDCDDRDAGVRPGAAERCNGRDDNCDGRIDESGAVGCRSYYRDEDGDGYGVGGDGRCLCAPEGVYRAALPGDCDDGLANVFPGAPESCNGLDDNCDGVTDEELATGCTLYYIDGDGDGVGRSGTGRCLCAPLAPYVATVAGDCDDDDPRVGPGGVEVCNGLDDDCNGLTDEPGAQGCVLRYMDVDGDGFGVTGLSKCLCAPEGFYRALVGGDCSDGDPLVFPGQVERCNGRDDDCDGGVDGEGALGCMVLLRDADGDSFGVTGDSRCLCQAAPPYTALRGNDCDDARDDVHPDAVEVCNGRDDNCDGRADDVGSIGCQTYYRDQDRDGYGSAESLCLCAATGEFTAMVAGDCRPLDPQVHPGAVERCNGVDDDCNGATDPDGVEGCLVRYRDADGDGFGVGGDSRCMCVPAAPYLATRIGDCDDTRGDVHPNAIEVCNGRDDNCDGVSDPEGVSGCTWYMRDEDGDGWSVSWDTRCLCQPDFPYRGTRGGDCDDRDALIHPEAVEICNGRDDNCDGLTDPAGINGCVHYFPDRDDDGYGASEDSLCLCAPSGDHVVPVGGDCCDIDDRAHPGPSGYYPTPTYCDHYDYNCNGVAERELTTTGGGCSGFFEGCNVRRGWSGSLIPGCGVQADYVVGGCGYCILPPGCCDSSTERRRQTCR